MRLFSLEKPLFESRRGDQVVQVVDTGTRHELRFGNLIVQSAFIPAQPDQLVLEYVRAMLAALLFVPQPENVLHLGLGGGSLPRFIHRHWPTVRQRVVEINPDVIEAAFRFFDVPVSRRLHVMEADGREFLTIGTDLFDLVFVDMFLANSPADGFDDPELLALQRRRLTPRGWAVYNAWGSDREGLKRLSARLAGLYPSLYAISVRSHSNVILIAGAAAEPPAAALLTSRAAALFQQAPFDFARWIPRLRPLGTAQRNPGDAWTARA